MGTTSPEPVLDWSTVGLPMYLTSPLPEVLAFRRSSTWMVAEPLPVSWTSASALAKPPAW
jgi:hypothetical protein